MSSRGEERSTRSCRFDLGLPPSSARSHFSASSRLSFPSRRTGSPCFQIGDPRPRHATASRKIGLRDDRQLRPCRFLTALRPNMQFRCRPSRRYLYATAALADPASGMRSVLRKPAFRHQPSNWAKV